MVRFFYNIVMQVAMFAARIVALWNPKVKLFVDGRKGLLDRIEQACGKEKDIIWFHTSSYGDFEEGRPIIDETRKRYPDAKILLTFFSPAGYEMRKTYKSVDWVFYLPMDNSRNVRRFLDIVRPKKAIFTLGEYWYNYLTELRERKIDTYVMSVRILPSSPYLKWYGFLHRSLFKTCYKRIIVKDAVTEEILHGIGASAAVKVGDARFDRVLDIANEPWTDPIVEKWACGKKVFIAGSTCEGDDDIVLATAAKHPEMKFLFIPHELFPEPVLHIKAEAKHGCVIYTETNPDDAALESAQILVINKVGLLARVYRYGFASYIGGGFINMPHSVIEPAVYGLPVGMGPQYQRDLHFVDLMEMGAGASFKNAAEFETWYDRLVSDSAFLEDASRKAAAYCAENKGATDTIMNLIFGD